MDTIIGAPRRPDFQKVSLWLLGIALATIWLPLPITCIIVVSGAAVSASTYLIVHELFQRGSTRLWRPLLVTAVLLFTAVFVSTIHQRRSPWNRADDFIHRKENATKQYWQSFVNLIPRREPVEDASAKAGPTFPDLKQDKSVITGIARSIRRLPTLHVDPELLTHALASAELLDRMAIVYDKAQYLVAKQKALNPTLGSEIESFVRGLFGDPLGKMNESRALKSELMKDWERLRGEMEQLEKERISLSTAEVTLITRLNLRYGS